MTAASWPRTTTGTQVSRTDNAPIESPLHQPTSVPYTRHPFTVFLATVAALATGTMTILGLAVPGFADTPDESTDPSPFQELELSGYIAALPEEPHFAGGTYLVTDGGSTVQITGEKVERMPSGTHFDGSVEIPQNVLDHASPDVENLDQAVEQILNEAMDLDVALRVLDAELQMPGSFDEPNANRDSGPEIQTRSNESKGSPHFADVVWYGKEGTVTPTESQVRDAVQRAGLYWGEETEGKMPGFTIRNVSVFASTDFDFCDQWPAWNKAAEMFGRTSGSYFGSHDQHLVVLVPGEVCGIGNGLGTVGGRGLDNGGVIWGSIDGSKPYEWHQVIVHEFGHNFSLGHSNILQCPSPRSDNPLPLEEKSECNIRDYGDYYDPMSGGWVSPSINNFGSQSSMNAVHKTVLGLLKPGGGLLDINAKRGKIQKLRLAPITSTYGTRALRIADPQSDETFFVEYRNGIDRDSDVFYMRVYTNTAPNSTPAMGPGIRVLKFAGGSSRSNNDTLSLRRFPQLGHDMNFDVTWYGLGDTFVSHDYFPGRPAVKIQVLTEDPEGATVRIELDPGLELLQAPLTKPVVTGGHYGQNTFYAHAAATDWQPAADEISFQWLRDDVAIEGATSSSYQWSDEDRGHDFTVEVTGSKWNYSPSAVSSATVIPGNLSIARIGGKSRYDTAVEVSRSTFTEIGGIGTVYVATGQSYPDALGAAAVAARIHAPLLLVPSKGKVPESVMEELRRLNPAEVVIVGGTNAVSAETRSEISQKLREQNPEISVQRVSGSSRYDTVRQLVANVFPDASTVVIATGRTFPDALSSAAAASQKEAPVLLVDGRKTALDQESADLLRQLGTESIYIVGGTGAVSEEIASSLEADYTVTRLSGKTRYETSQAINAEFFQVDSAAPTVSSHYWATGAGFADALAGAAAAGSTGSPLYVVNKICVPMPVLDHLEMKLSTSVVLLGGENALSREVAGLKGC